MNADFSSFLKLYSIKFLAFYSGCLSCFALRLHGGLSAITASSALGFAVTFVPLPASLDRKGIQLAFCTGTFVAMSSQAIISNGLHILLASLIGTLIYLLAKTSFTGLGGRMGAIAFLSTCLLVFAKVLT